jgi:hypothetical protein
VDSSKIRKTLPEFQPEWDARKGAQELYASYRQVGLKLDDFEGPKFKRIDHIKMLMGKGLLGPDLRWIPHS